MDFEERNKVYRWKIKADLRKFGLGNATIKEKNIPFIENPYQDVDWDFTPFKEIKGLFQCYQASPPKYWFNPPRVMSINVDNYQGIVEVLCNDTNKIEWYLNGNKIKTKYNVVGKFRTMFKVENLNGKELKFILYGDGGRTFSKTFGLLPQEVL